MRFKRRSHTFNIHIYLLQSANATSKIFCQKRQSTVDTHMNTCAIIPGMYISTKVPLTPLISKKGTHRLNRRVRRRFAPMFRLSVVGKELSELNGLNELFARDQSIVNFAVFNRVVSENIEKCARTIDEVAPRAQRREGCRRKIKGAAH